MLHAMVVEPPGLKGVASVTAAALPQLDGNAGQAAVIPDPPAPTSDQGWEFQSMERAQ